MTQTGTMKRRALVLIAWYFFFPWYSGSVVGPFVSREQCDNLRLQFTQRTSTCWEVPSPVGQAR